MSLSFQDILATVAAIVGTLGTLMGFMWAHFNNGMNELRVDINNRMNELRVDVNNRMNELRVDVKSGDEKLSMGIKSVEEKLGEKIDNLKAEIKADIKNVEEKIDSVRDRVSRIEGQLVPAKIISFEETRPKPAARSTYSKASQAK